MPSREPSMLTGWWNFAISALTALTTPRADVDACDRAIEDLARGSVVGGAIHRSSVAIRSAWSTSRLRGGLAAMVAAIASEGPASAWRVAGWMMAVAGAAALGLNQLATIAVGPMTWVVPAVLVAGGLFVTAAAGPLSRAAADRRLRRQTS